MNRVYLHLWGTEGRLELYKWQAEVRRPVFNEDDVFDSVKMLIKRRKLEAYVKGPIMVDEPFGRRHVEVICTRRVVEYLLKATGVLGWKPISTVQLEELSSDSPTSRTARS